MRKTLILLIIFLVVFAVPVVAEDFNVGPVVSANGFKVGAYAGGDANTARTTVIDSTGNVTGVAVSATNGVKVGTTTAAPTCNSTTRGTLWNTPGGGGVKDNVVVCAKDNTDAYSWRTIY